MKRIFVSYIFFLLLGQAYMNAQDINRLREREDLTGNNSIGDLDVNDIENDTVTRIDASTIPVDLYMWTVDERLGNMYRVPVDTLPHNFQNENLTDGANGEYNFLGNLGSPRQSRIFFNRPSSTQFIFLEPYSAFYVPPQGLKFTNTKSPFTNLTYHKGGNKRNGEDRFKAYFSVNANKRLAFGFNIDYWYGRGMYLYQSTSLFNGALFGSYVGERYNLHAIFSHNQIKLAENGGIEDDRYITDPFGISNGTQGSYSSTAIPVNLSNTWNENKNFYVFLTHRYNLGFNRETADSLGNNIKEFVPVTSFIHTLNVQRSQRRFIEYGLKTREVPYNNFFLHNDSTNDITKNLSVKNTFGISLQEGFSKWAKAGLTAFITHEHRNFSLVDTIGADGDIPMRKLDRTYKENVVSIGGEFAKRQGRILHYDVNGDFAILGEDIGQFSVNGKIDLNFRLFKDTVRLDANAFVKNTNPSFYFRNFHSNHYWWENSDLSKEFRTRIEGKLTIDRWRTQLSAGVENIKNYTYFRNADNTAEGVQHTYANDLAVAQESGNIQIFSATLKQNFKFGILHLDNEVTYQKSSNNTVIPLPELNLYHNLYISARIVKVLRIQLGADVRYFTKYHAPSYYPGIGQFAQQNQNQLIEIGGYPFVNVYANLHLKRTRFYVMMSHVNSGMGDPNYFLAPHYPTNPSLFRMGLSWNFFD